VTPFIQVAAVLVIAVFIVLIAVGCVSRRTGRRPTLARRAAPPVGGSAAPPGDHRAGGEDFRAEALAVAGDDAVTTGRSTS
jgi:hypothetical protein